MGATKLAQSRREEIIAHAIGKGRCCHCRGGLLLFIGKPIVDPVEQIIDCSFG